MVLTCAWIYGMQIKLKLNWIESPLAWSEGKVASCVSLYSKLTWLLPQNWGSISLLTPHLIQTNCCLLLVITSLAHPSTPKIEAVHYSELMVNFYWTAWHHIPEDSTLIVTTMRTSNWAHNYICTLLSPPPPLMHARTRAHTHTHTQFYTILY
jgi:hypothetical protein